MPARPRSKKLPAASNDAPADSNGGTGTRRGKVDLHMNGWCMPISHTRAVTRQLKTSETVARRLVQSVIADGLAPGDPLPTEAAMLDQYDVSRESLREGLRLLEVQGLLTIRRGPSGGPSVGTVDPANLGRISTLFYHMAGATYGELSEAWVMSEGILAERAARNPDAKARQAAMAPFCEEPNMAGKDLDEYLLESVSFHGVIASLARNRVLELSLQAPGSIVSHHFFVEHDPRSLRDLIEHDHLQLARAVSAGHAKIARSLMEDHIENVIRGAPGFQERLHDYVDWI